MNRNAEVIYKDMLGMEELLRAFEHRSPEIVFEWKDSETDAKGWIVINSLRGGAAGGGTRMRAGLDRHEVESLAKTMEVKFTVSGPAIGGAKSGIDFDPHDPRKNEVLDRWFKVVTPLLKNYYGTGGDLNIDEIHDVIPLTEEYGLWHPQEGILNGHFKVNESNRIHQIGQLRYGVSKVLEDNTYSPDLKRKYKVADMITGYGVSESIRHYYQLFGSDCIGKRAVIQGWGNVAAAAAFYLSKLGVKIVGIIDRAGGLINREGFSEAEITQLFLDRKGNELNSPDLMSFEQIQKEIWGLKSDIFVPAAASRLVSKDQIQQLLENGLEVIASGANVPFADQEIFYGPVMEFADQHVAVIPDFIANCGMARVFAYLMQRNIEMSDDAIFSDVSKVIFEALKKIRDSSADRTQISSRAYEIALKQLV
ncbi:Glu/Leu/Phe/Val dehydrogenase dimerization domain-containing protein [Sphingobacterium sp. BIGb0165]|uniref:Glu/Leu/Phe/Val dehydrogenase dimerization domain-containing protein n=1 Tax=Sphingobacterium sp. BIGb0165 TaxID=2940615 RepID=UPI002167AE00|nr:Glu/Leu/Phe/Val dehydrogenase dimerization domain-containing protein [Sphingobacterium sp. BIGb0165]MCS4225386.1 glutamate dehydrogenase/leucine dehydrogenase [Sphingobacterium sp. BIGb0165]